MSDSHIGEFSLAANAEMLFTDLPFVERVSAIDSAGFQVEMWDWSNRDLPALAATGATFSSMTGYLRGELIDSDGAHEIVRTATESLKSATIIDVPRLNLHGTGLDGNGLPVRPQETTLGSDFLRAARTLERLAKLAEEHGRVFTLENLNRAVDHPGVPFAAAADTIALVEAVDSPHLRLNLDLYHAQTGEGNLVELIERAMPLIGEIQIADVPGRQEPGTGEINYPVIANTLRNLGYDGAIALEAFASTTPQMALDTFRQTFE